MEDLLAYAKRESIGLFCGIYERDETLKSFLASGLPIVPLFWERKPLSPNIPLSARGIKLHPYIEDYVFEKRNVAPALEEARKRNLPVMVHSDNRKPSLSRGRLFATIAREFPDVTFILAHAGSYAPGNIEVPGASLTDENLVRELVSEAIDVAIERSNVFLEVSILASRAKARLIADKAPIDKVLFGSDFPIQKSIFGSIMFQENALLEAGVPHETLRAFHKNGVHLFGSGVVPASAAAGM